VGAIILPTTVCGDGKEEMGPECSGHIECGRPLLEKQEARRNGASDRFRKGVRARSGKVGGCW
jgi:hypothetical protein